MNFSGVFAPLLLFCLVPPVPSLPSSPLAQHRTDPQIFPNLVRTQEDSSNRIQRKYFMQKKAITNSDVVRPGLNFVTNGQPGKVRVVKENRQEAATTTTTPPPTTTVPITSFANNTSPFTWLTNSYLFNGLPSNIFSLPSPMQWVGSTFSGLGTVINHSRMGPHVLLG